MQSTWQFLARPTDLHGEHPWGRILEEFPTSLTLEINSWGLGTDKKWGHVYRKKLDGITSQR